MKFPGTIFASRRLLLDPIHESSKYTVCPLLLLRVPTRYATYNFGSPICMASNKPLRNCSFIVNSMMGYFSPLGYCRGFQDRVFGVWPRSIGNAPPKVCRFCRSPRAPGHTRSRRERCGRRNSRRAERLPRRRSARGSWARPPQTMRWMALTSTATPWRRSCSSGEAEPSALARFDAHARAMPPADTRAVPSAPAPPTRNDNRLWLDAKKKRARDIYGALTRRDAKGLCAEDVQAGIQHLGLPCDWRMAEGLFLLLRPI